MNTTIDTQNFFVNATKNLESFFVGYLYGLNQTVVDRDEEHLFPELGDFDESTLTRLKNTCDVFVADNLTDLELFCTQASQATYTKDDIFFEEPWELAGYLFLMTQNDHSTGFWDAKGIEKKLGERLSEAASKIKPVQIKQWRDGYFRD